MTRLSFIVIAFFLVLAACTAKLQQHSNNNTSNNPTTVDKGLQGGAGKRDSVRLEDLIYPRSSRKSANDCYYLFDTSKSNKVLTFEPEHFFENYRTLLSIPQTMTFKVKTRKENFKFTRDSIHVWYQVYYKGIPTQKSVHVTLYPNKSIQSIDLSFPFNLTEDFDVTPAITEPEAFALVLKAKPGHYAWEEGYKDKARATFGIPDRIEINPPKGELLIWGNRLAYYYYLFTYNDHLQIWKIYIDAQTGETIGIHNDLGR